MDRELEPAVLACSLSQSALAQRVERWHALNLATQPAVTETEHGLRLSYPAGPTVTAELHALATLERTCCAFATWSVSQQDGRVNLDIEAIGEEAIGAVQQLFADLR
jgi:hypothetical protein